MRHIHPLKLANSSMDAGRSVEMIPGRVWSFWNKVKMPSDGNHPLTLQFGLINHEGRYLTAEMFGFKVNASAPSMKKKQIWTLEQDTQDSRVVYLRSHLRRYLASDKDGKVTCETDGRHSDCRFLIVAQSDGRWALQSEQHLRFFGGSRDYLSCFAQGITDAELWSVHLALHPQANLLSVARKRYAHLSEEDGEISVDMNIPWGVASILTLVYQNGKYCLKTCDSRFLSNDGKLVKQSDKTTTYTLELKCGKLAFKDCEGKYLSPTGPTGTLRSGRCSKPGKDELFDLEESQPQVVLMAANGKYVSMRQGVSLAANQEDETDMETFQMEMDKESRKCTFRTMQGNYWALVAHGGIQRTASQLSANSMFAMEWLGHKLALKANNGKYICTKKNGQLLAVSDSIGEDEQLSLKLINRPMLILRGENGFVCHHKNSNTLDASRSVYDIFSLQFSNGAYHIKGVNGRFWYVNSAGLVCSDGEAPEDFSVELRERGRLAIRSTNGRYLRGDQGGTLKADGLSLSSSALWEY
ncbi:fascin-2b isoform X2 [Phyllopteryx taeniolatus]|uniref:fascin-2b isoform X2 n=1 Tax=Phyllopteryx taeniolatus TaxID=161469 RepID=UPI002AD487D6|nr:fascin-2b isoform X2 [Phyllopteryx taeniolatus]